MTYSKDLWPDEELPHEPDTEMLVDWVADRQGRAFGRCPHCGEKIIDGLQAVEIQGVANAHYAAVHLPEILAEG